MGKLISIGTAVPENGTRQNNILEFMQKAYRDDSISRKLRILFNSSGINKRYSVIPDFNQNTNDPVMFDGNPDIPSVANRLEKFKKYSVGLAIAAIHNSFKKLNTTVAEFKPTHLITVSCTGIYAPGIQSAIIEQLNLPEDIFHTSVNFMGCNAAFSALKIADMISKTDEHAKVLVVCVELCTLHFLAKNNHDNLLSNTIFADGAAAALVVSDKIAKQKNQAGLEINGFYSLLLQKGKNLMEWNITPVNFEMVLDAKVPDFIGDVVDEILIKASKKLNIDSSKIGKWAIHPGGKKILDVIKKKLKLAESDLEYSYKVLADYGNMSSPTILFVINEFMQAGLDKNETIFSVGFGPGLSVETCLFTHG